MKPYFSKEMHDALEAIAKLYIPFAIAIIFGFSKFIDIPWSEAAIGCLGVLDAAIGTLMEASTRNYKKSLEEKNKEEEE